MTEVRTILWRSKSVYLCVCVCVCVYIIVGILLIAFSESLLGKLICLNEATRYEGIYTKWMDKEWLQL
jgi:hypothetical protein